MPASLRIELFPSSITRTIAFYTRVLSFTLLEHKDQGTYAYLQRDAVFIGVVVNVPPHVPGESVDVKVRRPPAGVEIVLEVDDVQAERGRVVRMMGELEGEGRGMGGMLMEDLVERPWGLTDFRICDPDGYYLRITNQTRT